MLINAVADKGILAKTVLFDSWYAAWQHLKRVNSLKLTFYLCPLGLTTLKNNRLVSLSKEEGHVHLDDIGTPGQIEQFLREIKQLTGSEKCQCRKAWPQRNHLACCYHAWISLKMKAKAMKTTLYQIRKNLFYDYLKTELDNPRITAYSGG
ncbi:MAG: hypothetical protein PHR16_00155 [Methylovulum sp.]|nr:hypothetical protein [Methylovulum sp.]